MLFDSCASICKPAGKELQILCANSNSVFEANVPRDVSEEGNL